MKLIILILGFMAFPYLTFSSTISNHQLGGKVIVKINKEKRALHLECLRSDDRGVCQEARAVVRHLSFGSRIDYKSFSTSISRKKIVSTIKLDSIHSIQSNYKSFSSFFTDSMMNFRDSLQRLCGADGWEGDMRFIPISIPLLGIGFTLDAVASVLRYPLFPGHMILTAVQDTRIKKSVKTLFSPKKRGKKVRVNKRQWNSIIWAFGHMNEWPQ